MGSRAAQFFSALPWAISVLATNISANSTAVGNDLMVLFPRWINIRRGQYITAVLGLVTCPWIIQSTAKTFTAFLGGYTVRLLRLPLSNDDPERKLTRRHSQVFLAPLGGVLMSEFLLVRKRRISLPDLFTTQSSVYWYSHGWNFRGVVAFVLGIVPCLPGFIRNVNSKLDIPVQATYVYVSSLSSPALPPSLIDALTHRRSASTQSASSLAAGSTTSSRPSSLPLLFQPRTRRNSMRDRTSARRTKRRRRALRHRVRLSRFERVSFVVCSVLPRFFLIS